MLVESTNLIKLDYLFFIFIIALALQSCSLDPCGDSKDDFLANYNGLLEKVKTENLSFSDGGWTDYDDQFQIMIESCYENYEAELSAKELSNFWTNAIEYYYKRYGVGFVKELKNKNNLKEVSNDVEKWGKKIEDVFKKKK